MPLLSAAGKPEILPQESLNIPTPGNVSAGGQRARLTPWGERLLWHSCLLGEEEEAKGPGT